MVKHIVLFKLKEFNAYNERTYICSTFKEKLENLKNKIKVINNLEVGVNINPVDVAYDIALTVEVNDFNALNTYREHPEHKKVLEFINKVKEKVVVVDYIID